MRLEKSMKTGSTLMIKEERVFIGFIFKSRTNLGEHLKLLNAQSLAAQSGKGNWNCQTHMFIE